MNWKDTWIQDTGKAVSNIIRSLSAFAFVGILIIGLACSVRCERTNADGTKTSWNVDANAHLERSESVPNPPSKPLDLE